MKNLKSKLFFAVIITASVLYLSGCNRPKSEPAATNQEQPKEEVIYTCTMHPEIQESKPGNCPICNMALVVKEPDSHE